MANVVGEHTIKANIIGGGTPISANIVQNKKKIVSEVQTFNQATTTTKGIIRIATLAEAEEGTDNSIAITPYTLAETTKYGSGNGIDINGRIISIDEDITATKEFVNGIKDELDNDISTIQNTLNTFGDVVTYDASDFATAAQGALADTSLQPNDNISELINDSGYITNSALNGYATENFVTSQGYITGIDSTDVTTALGYVPYNSTNPNGYITSADLPTVNNATLTIQTNGADVATFTANSAINQIANIIVPTTASDINALPDNTKYGKSIDVLLNTTDYKLTISLKDQDGTILNSKVVDFPVESMVVSGSFDSVNKKIILTLQNGNTTDIPVGDLISGLQTEITSNNKLDSDLVDDTNQINKFVTTTEKSTWNNKQDTISDLASIRSNATNGQNAYTTIQNYGNIVTHNTNEFATATQGGKADTALQPNDNISELTNDVGYITSASLPTVNNGTLDIQVNGTSVGTFTANQSGNTTANIVVPDSATWGNITGDIEDQTDLQDALDSKQDTLVAGTDLEILRGSAVHNLPDGYTEVEFIQANGNAGILTSVAGNINTNVTLIANCTQILSTSQVIISDGYDGNGGTYFGQPSNKSTWGAGANGSQITSLNVLIKTEFNISSTITNTFALNGTVTQGSTIQTFSRLGSVPVSGNYTNWSLFGSINKNNNTIAYAAYGKVYYAKFEQNNTVVAEYIPAIRNSDNTVGLYDIVNDTFIARNLGTGTLMAGEKVAETATINFTNESGYITGINNLDVVSALGYTPVHPSSLATVATSGDYDDLTNKPTIPTVGDGTITITQGGVTKGTFTTNQSGNSTIALDAGGGGGSYSAGTGIVISNDTISIDTSVVAQLSDIPTNYVTTDTAQNITGRKTFLGEKAIYFKQSATTDKLGFTLYNSSNTELGAFEWRPSTISGGALLNINVPYSSSNYVGFRYWGTAVNIIAPKVATAGNYYIPTHITDGTNTVTANSNGTINISSLLPNVSGYLENTATGTDSLTILGFDTNYNSAINIGSNSSANGNFSVAIGSISGDDYYAEAGLRSVAIGSGAGAEINSVAIGYEALCFSNTNNSIAIGYQAFVSESDNNTTIYAIQLGEGENTTSNTMQVWNYPLLDKTTGLIPDARLSSNIARTSQIPTVNNATITITQGGVTKGTFTTNQSGNSTIALDAGGTGGIQNTATGWESLTILGTSARSDMAINIGANSTIQGTRSIAIGNESTAETLSVAIGYQAAATASSSIQLGNGTNSTQNTLQVGNYTLLNTSTGLIPDARLSSNIARTSQIPTVPTMTYTSATETLTFG